MDLGGMYPYLCLGFTSNIATEAQNTVKPIEKLRVEVVLSSVLLLALELAG